MGENEKWESQWALAKEIQETVTSLNDLFNEEGKAGPAVKKTDANVRVLTIG